MIRTDQPNSSGFIGAPTGAGAGMARDAKRIQFDSVDHRSPTDREHAPRLENGSVTIAAARAARILIVARPATSRAISATLALAGYEVHRTPDANSAVEVAQRLRPQLAIVATEVPGSSGGSVARLLRSSQANLPIILLGTVGEPPQTGELAWVPADIAPAMLLATVADQLMDQPPTRTADVR